MALKPQCCICLDLFPGQNLTQRPCCQRSICLQCFPESPRCLDCSTLATKEVNLAQLQQEIIRIQEIAQEQTQFYSQYPCPEQIADAKAIRLHLELLQELEQRLISLCDPTVSDPTSPQATVFIPTARFIRSKTLTPNGTISDVSNYHGCLYTNQEQDRLFFESHHIDYAWRGGIPAPVGFLKSLDLCYCSGTNLDGLTPVGSEPARLVALSIYETPIINIDGLSASKLTLTRMTATDTPISDIKVLAGMPLVYLNLENTPLADITPLSSCGSLTELNLALTRVVDLTALASITTLTNLNVGNTAVVTLDGLETLPLKELDLGSSLVEDLTALAGTPRQTLKILDLSYTKVVGLYPLTGSVLVELDLTSTDVSDITSLASLTKLTSLDLAWTQVDDLWPLRELSLQYLGLQSLTELFDITALSQMTTLETLVLSQTGLWNLQPLAKLVNLSRLYLDKTRIDDVKGLSGLINLASLHLEGTEITDLVGLNQLPLEYLNVSGCNNLVDISGLAGQPIKHLKTLNIQNTAVTDFSLVEGIEGLHLNRFRSVRT